MRAVQHQERGKRSGLGGDDLMDDAATIRAISSFTTGAGIALGELLVLTERSEDLLEHLCSIHVCAKAAIMCAETGESTASIGRPDVSLAGAALGVIKAWHEETQDLAALGDAIAVLQEVLEEMGMRYVPPGSDE